MSTRRKFLQTLGATILAGAATPMYLASCAGPFVYYRARVKDGAIVVPKSQTKSLTEPNGILLVRADGVRGPIALRNVENEEVVAVSIICTHRGCEVRPMPDSFECPCHGSAYDLDGSVLEGPARLPLKRFPLQETADAFVIKIS